MLISPSVGLMQRFSHHGMARFRIADGDGL